METRCDRGLQLWQLVMQMYFTALASCCFRPYFRFCIKNSQTYIIETKAPQVGSQPVPTAAKSPEKKTNNKTPTFLQINDLKKSCCLVGLISRPSQTPWGGDLLGDPVVKSPHFTARGVGSIPSQDTKMPHAQGKNANPMGLV